MEENHIFAVGDVAMVNYGDEVVVKKMPKGFRDISRGTSLNVTVGKGFDVATDDQVEQHDSNLQKCINGVTDLIEGIFNVGCTDEEKEKIDEHVRSITPHNPRTKYDTTAFVGEYVVVREHYVTTRVTDWGRDYGSQTYHHVVAKKLNNGGYDPDGVELLIDDTFEFVRKMNIGFS